MSHFCYVLLSLFQEIHINNMRTYHYFLLPFENRHGSCMSSEEFLYKGQCLENLMVNRTAKITELSKAIHHLNKGKAAGIDQFSGEMLKRGGKVKTGRLHYLGKE